jgi:hypothetical protein
MHFPLLLQTCKFRQHNQTYCLPSESAGLLQSARVMANHQELESFDGQSGPWAPSPDLVFDVNPAILAPITFIQLMQIKITGK